MRIIRLLLVALAVWALVGGVWGNEIWLQWPDVPEADRFRVQITSTPIPDSVTSAGEVAHWTVWPEIVTGTSIELDNNLVCTRYWIVVIAVADDGRESPGARSAPGDPNDAWLEAQWPTIPGSINGVRLFCNLIPDPVVSRTDTP